MALLAMAIANLGLEGRSFTGSQAGVITDSAHGKARIIDITPGRIQSALDQGAIPIVAGFQGVSQDGKDITTLGRGGTDTTAVALAAALGADYCEIYTDVDCVEYARRYSIPIHVRSSFSNREGTWVTGSITAQEGSEMEQPIISGVAHDRSEAKITVVGVPDKVGEAALIFRVIADAAINIDMIVQNISAAATGRTDISFTLPREDGQAAMEALRRVKDEVGFDSLLYNDRIGKVSLIGAGMRSHPGVSATFFGALAGAGVNIEMISTSEIRISVVVDENDVNQAVTATHQAFDLASADEEAVVYGGSGR
jgi:aspartate kinase